MRKQSAKDGSGRKKEFAPGGKLPMTLLVRTAIVNVFHLIAH